MIAVEKILLNHERTLQGVEEMPGLGWVLKSDGRNVRQKAYRWQLAEDKRFAALLYDSGWVESDESAHIAGPDIPLQPCREYFIRCRVKSPREESGWSDPACFLTGMAGGGWKGGFVSAEKESDWGNSRGTYLRKSWRVCKPVREAFLCATALGLYSMSINGQRVGDEQFLPGWTTYPEHLCYQTWKVTGLLRQGENVLGAHLGAGWYKGMMGFIHERCTYGRRTALLCQLTVRYEDGTEETVVTDESWLGCASPVTFSEIYDGERCDARLEQPGWNEPGFDPEMGGAREETAPPLRDRWKEPFSDEEKAAQRRFAREYRPEDTLWRPADRVDYPLDGLTPQPAARTVTEMILPVRSILTTPKGETVLDFGQNLTGHVRFTVRGRA